MKKTLLIVFTLLIGFSCFSQVQRDRFGTPQNTEPTAADLAKRERFMEERKAEYIKNFLSTLEADDFQKEITKQYINSFFDKKIALLKEQYDHSLDRKQVIKKLEDTHFKDLEELISENDMAKIKKMIKGEFDEKEIEDKKKKKKKRKKRKKKKDEDDNEG